MNKCELLKTIRKRLGWTQRELADHYGVQREVISYWESGKRPIPSEILKKLKKLERLGKEKALVQFGKKPKLSILPQENVTSRAQKRREGSIEQITPGKYSNHNSRDKSYRSKDMLLHSLEENHSKNEGVCGNEIPKEGTIERQLLDGLIAFKKRNKNRYPTTQDFKGGKIKSFSLHEIKDCFGSLQKARKIATEIRRLQRQRKEKDTKPRGAKSRCPLCGNWVVDIIQHYDNMRLWINSILNDTKKESYRDAVLEIRDKILFPEKCFCGGFMRKDWKSTLRLLITSRLKMLFQSADSKSPLDAIEDCRKAIFGNAGKARKSPCYLLSYNQSKPLKEVFSTRVKPSANNQGRVLYLPG